MRTAERRQPESRFSFGETGDALPGRAWALASEELGWTAGWMTCCWVTLLGPQHCCVGAQ